MKTVKTDYRRSSFVLFICLMAVMAAAFQDGLPKISVVLIALIVLVIMTYSKKKWLRQGSPTSKVLKALLLVILAAALTVVLMILFIFFSITQGGLTF